MKIIAAASLFFLTVSCAMAGAQEVVMRTAAQGAYAAGGSAEQRALLATDAATLAELWKTHVGGEPVPAVDFSREAAVLLMGGERMTGGWSVVPQSVRLEENVLVVEAVVQGPPAGSMTTQALTYPWALIAVSPNSIESVRWETKRAQ
jgi:hypothetical protein